MSNQNHTARDYLMAAAATGVEAAALQVKLNDVRGGAYTNSVRAAIVSGDAETYEREVTTFMEQIRGNVDGLAEGLGCSMDKKGEKYVVPSAVSASKSYMLSAFEYGIDLGTEEKPNPFSAIRTAVQEAKATAEKERIVAEGGDDLVRLEISNLLSKLASIIEAAEGDTLETIRAELQGVVTVGGQSNNIDKARRLAAERTPLEVPAEIDATESAVQFAGEHNIDLSSVQGSGKDGRITLGDVRKAA